MTKIKILLPISAILFATAAPTQAFAQLMMPGYAPAVQTSASVNANGAVLGTQTSVPPLIAQIKQAKQMLDTVKLDYKLTPVYKNVKDKKTKKTTEVLSSYSLTSKDIALAVLDPATNQISIVVGMQKGKTMSFNDPNVSVKLVTFNGVNSRFAVSKPENGTVLALKYLITGTESGGKAAIEGDMHETLYVPYSANLNQPDVITYGEQYIAGVVDRVANDIQHIPSQAIPGKMIPEAIPPALIRALVYAEHTDTATVMRGDLDTTINQLNVLFATNEGDTYKYSGSSAGALGIAQFIKSTYLGLVKRHPEAGLIDDFELGMADHYNSIKAMYILLDDYAGTVRVKAQLGFKEGLVFDYGAASYNGGTTRVVKAVNTLGFEWNADHSDRINALKADAASLKAQIKKAKDKKSKADLQSELNAVNSQISDLEAAALRNETVNYLQKIYKVIPHFNS